MSRVISTGDLHNVVTKRKMEYGKLATLVDNIVEEMVEETPTAIRIPDGATNGNMLMIMFPNLKVEIEGNYITCWIDEHRWFSPDYNWWNAPYKKQVIE